MESIVGLTMSLGVRPLHLALMALIIKVAVGLTRVAIKILVMETI